MFALRLTGPLDSWDESCDVWFLCVTCFCCPYLYVGSPIMWVTYLGSWMITCLGKSCSFGLPRLPFVNCCHFMYLVIFVLVLRAGYGIWLYQFLIIAYLFTLHSCPQEAKEAAYKEGLVRPVLEYGSLGSPGVVLQEELERVQKCAARFVTENYKYEIGSLTGILG